jgi:ABC-type branched-subunit amino acid transport system substrate-binding protein
VHAFAATQPAGRVPGTAVYAAAAVDVMLEAIARSDGTRASVTRALAATRLSATPLGPIAFDHHGEPRANPITIVRADRGGADPALLGLAGSVITDVISPSRELAGPGAGR